MSMRLNRVFGCTMEKFEYLFVLVLPIYVIIIASDVNF